MLESNAGYAVTFLDEKKDSCKLVLENCNYESASATHTPYNSQQKVFRCNVAAPGATFLWGRDEQSEVAKSAVL